MKAMHVVFSLERSRESLVSLMSTSVTGKTKSRDQMLDWRPCLPLKVFLEIEEEEVHSSILHQTNEDIYGKTVSLMLDKY